MTDADWELDAAHLGTLSGPAVVSIAIPDTQSRQRLRSLDALRGFTMLWIIGGREFVLGVAACFYPPLFDAVETQLTHPKWAGFVAWDLVMPVFLFVVGTTIPLSIGNRGEQQQSLGTTYRRIARRVVVLWALGMLIQAIRYELVVPEVYSNTLQAIAVGYLVTSIALLHLRIAGQIALFVVLVVGYWALLMFVPFADNPAGTLEKTTNFARYIDEIVLHIYRRDHSFTWVVTSLGFSATVLLGAMAGHLLQSRRLSTKRKLLFLTLLGVGCLAGGWLWSYSIPLNRHLWTSSMILWAGGWSFLLLVLFHSVIDLAGMDRWAYPFSVIGANALLAYALDPTFDWLSKASTGIPLEHFTIPEVGMPAAILEITSLWLLLWILYRRRIFFRA